MLNMAAVKMAEKLFQIGTMTRFFTNRHRQTQSRIFGCSSMHTVKKTALLSLYKGSVAAVGVINTFPVKTVLLA